LFALATVALPRGQSVAALRVDGEYWPLPAAGLPSDAMALFADWRRSFALLEKFSRKPKGKPIAEKKAKLLTPLRYPRKLFCVGANYKDHLEEMNAGHLAKKVPGAPPFFFMKPPSTTLVGPGRTVRIPQGCENFDWEVEFVVVFGKGGRDISEKNAMRHVAGYSVGIDFTARDLFFREDSFFKFNFVLGKCQDTMSPVGPAVVPKQFLDGQNARFSLSVNDALKQSGTTADMIYSLPEQIAGVSRAVSIEPGDMMFTGSPAGVGLPRGEKLKPGDRIRIEAELVGSMEVVIR
jgi:2-keto-4-pentenoate hydratase/2-oxohepta-3-ene-1,7-dioic acid hydratase in catechol pathway